MWQTYTPDGRVIAIRKTESGWLATCLANRVESASAEQAIREAIGEPLEGTREELDRWIVEHAVDLEAAAAE
ncbi:MAG TPA: hypothetical protein VGM80_10125 [Gaiellaceae bacterium]|jgi:hypothetical protein